MGAIHKQCDVCWFLQCLSTTSKGMLSSGKLTASRWDAISSSSSSRSVVSSRHPIAGTEGKLLLYCTYVDVTWNTQTYRRQHTSQARFPLVYDLCQDFAVFLYAYRFTPNRSFSVCVFGSQYPWLKICPWEEGQKTDREGVESERLRHHKSRNERGAIS